MNSDPTISVKASTPDTRAPEADTPAAAKRAPDPERPSAIPDALPILPIRDTVLFPGTVLPMTIGRQASRKLLEESLPQGKIIGLNGWIKGYAARSGAVYLDYYSALADGRNLKKELTVDGLLPNDAGYGVMAPLAAQAIEQALR